MSHAVAEPVDLRVRRTQLLIRDAFMALLIEQGFDKVTVQAIAERANINRATFYRHYTDKFDLAEKFTEILFADVAERLAENVGQTSTESVQILFEHVAEYADFYRAMLGKGGIPGFQELVRESVESQFAAQLPLMGFRVEQLKMPQPLPIRYIAAAQVGFIQWWLENDMPFPPEQAADYLLQLHTFGASWALGLVEEDVIREA